MAGPSNGRMGGGGGMTNPGMGAFNTMASMMGAMPMNSMGNMGAMQEDFNFQMRGGGQQQMMGRGPRGPSVCIVYGVKMDVFNCKKLFNMFCQYGNLKKVMFLKSKEGTAMMEMGSPEQVQNVVDNFSNAEMFGCKVRADWSKKEYLSEVHNPFKLPDGSNSYNDYENDRHNRFMTPERAAKNRIMPPTRYLHFFNVPQMDDDEMENVFADAGAPTPVSIKWLNNKDSKLVSGIMQFASIEDACEAICVCNHHEFKGDKKYPQVMKLCFSNGPREDRGAGGKSRH